MRPFVVVALPERIEAPLLRPQTVGSGTRGLALQLAMHAFVGAVLLGARGRDALMHDAELHPPDIQGRQAVNAR